jgi:hypothetical protein
MSYISELPSDTSSEGKPAGWRHWWDKAPTPSSGDDSLPPLDSAEEWLGVEEDAEEQGSEEAAVARAKAEADAKANTAKAKAQPASTGDNEEDSDASADTLFRRGD